MHCEKYLHDIDFAIVLIYFPLSETMKKPEMPGLFHFRSI